MELFYGVILLSCCAIIVWEISAHLLNFSIFTECHSMQVLMVMRVNKWQNVIFEQTVPLKAGPSATGYKRLYNSFKCLHVGLFVCKARYWENPVQHYTYSCSYLSSLIQNSPLSEYIIGDWQENRLSDFMWTLMISMPLQIKHIAVSTGAVCMWCIMKL